MDAKRQSYKQQIPREQLVQLLRLHPTSAPRVLASSALVQLSDEHSLKVFIFKNKSLGLRKYLAAFRSFLLSTCQHKLESTISFDLSLGICGQPWIRRKERKMNLAAPEMCTNPILLDLTCNEYRKNSPTL